MTTSAENPTSVGDEITSVDSQANRAEVAIIAAAVVVVFLILAVGIAILVVLYRKNNRQEEVDLPSLEKTLEDLGIPEITDVTLNKRIGGGTYNVMNNQVGMFGEVW